MHIDSWALSGSSRDMSPLGIPNPALWIWKGAFVLEGLLADCPSSQVDNLSISFRWGILLSLQRSGDNKVLLTLLTFVY